MYKTSPTTEEKILDWRTTRQIAARHFRTSMEEKGGIDEAVEGRTQEQTKIDYNLSSTLLLQDDTSFSRKGKEKVKEKKKGKCNSNGRGRNSAARFVMTGPLEENPEPGSWDQSPFKRIIS